MRDYELFISENSSKVLKRFDSLIKRMVASNINLLVIALSVSTTSTASVRFLFQKNIGGGEYRDRFRVVEDISEDQKNIGLTLKYDAL